MQQMEHDGMTTKKHPQQRGSKERETPRDTRSDANRPTEVSPALSNDGPELIRDTHC
jgi:hypothetical protein